MGSDSRQIPFFIYIPLDGDSSKGDYLFYFNTSA